MISNNNSDDKRLKIAMKRYQMINSLVEEGIDPARKNQLRKEISVSFGISQRTLRRYEDAYVKGGLSSLMPAARSGATNKKLPAGFSELLQDAIQLKREVPTRSVEQIILILEREGRVAPGLLKRSTLQKYLLNAGWGKKNLIIYKQDQQQRATRRFCHPNRMMLVQADIKYGVGIFMNGNRSKNVYLSSIIDDHSRFILSSQWFEKQDIYSVEYVFRDALVNYGKFDSAYTDNGKVYISDHLNTACARLGIKLKRAPIRSGRSKGKIEKFHQVVDDFIAEVKLQKPSDINELNRYWRIYLNEYYHKRPHDGIREYYQSQGVPIPPEGITPEQEFLRDTRPLRHYDINTITEAFKHQEYRWVDEGGCVKINGNSYDAGPKYLKHKIKVIYDPLNMDTIEIIPEDNAKPYIAKKMEISAYCKRGKPIKAVKPGEVDHSRMLDVLEKGYEKSVKKVRNALSFAEME